MSIPDRLKEMFRRNRQQPGPFICREFQLNDDKLRDIGKDAQLTTRLKTLKDLYPSVLEQKLENQTIAILWSSIEDLFGREQTVETRHLAFTFLQNLVKGQIENLKLLRAQFFRFIKLHNNPEDVSQRLELLNTLTSNGKDITYFEEEVGPFLLNWFLDITKNGKLQDYLNLIDNVIRYNAAYLDEDVINGFIQHICVPSCCINNSETVMACLKIMSTIVAYSNMSPESLPIFIGALCRTVTIENYWSDSWKIMKNLLGTHMGHSALYTMCSILKEPLLQSDVNLLRGAVFYIHMALWGSQPLTSLHCPPSSVLPSILQGVTSNQPAVAYEVTQGLKNLVNKYGYELQDPAWSVLLEILLQIIKIIEKSPTQIPNNLTSPILQDTLTIIECLIDKGRYNGSIEQYYAIIEECVGERPEPSTMKLIIFLSNSIVPTEHGWLKNLDNLLTKYFKPEVRTKIRLKVLEVLTDVVKLYRMQYEDDLIDKIIIPHLSSIELDPDMVIRSSVAELLVELCMKCDSKKCLEMLDILKKLLFRPFKHATDNSTITDIEHSDVKHLVKGLITVFMHKIHKLPSSTAIKIYEMLVHFLELHYNKPKVFENCNQVRYMIFDCFLKMRADSFYRLGCPSIFGSGFKYSPYLCVIYNDAGERGGSIGSPPPPAHSPAVLQLPPCTVTYVPLRPAFKTFITCLTHERDWHVLSMVLTEMTKALQNKSLILSKQGNNELHTLVETLCGMISDRRMNLPETLHPKTNKQQFHAAVLQVLVNLASYHSYLNQAQQQEMIRCLMKCIQTGPPTSKQCIAALTICTLEMREAMVKMLPAVLLNLSKISATLPISIPVLEFLSTLTQLPMVFANFVADQYMAVFAISLPYTNPFKYNHYTVSLAHHVIAVWFLKCRLPFRKDFVKFITNGLQTNVLIPFEETSLLKSELSNLNQDSSDRKRSSSLTEQGSRRRTQNISVNKPAAYLQRSTAIDKPDKSLMTFYEELTETCIDLMARYAFSPCSALPKRLPTAEFLLNGGQSMCWLIGNKLVTVTTSGCSQKVLKHGLCDKCWTLCGTARSDIVAGRSARSGSGDQQDSSNRVTRQNSNDKSNNNTSVSSPIDENKKLGTVEAKKLDLVSTKLQQLVGGEDRHEKPNCACWCQGWAEVYIRRPTGDMSWVMRIQNQVSFQHSMYEFPLNELSTLFMPTLHQDICINLPRQGTSSEEASNLDEDQQTNKESAAVSNPITVESPVRQSPSRQNSRDSVDEDLECIYDDGSKSRNPVKRSNSSPEMSANWKSPFLQRESDDAKNLDDDNMKKNKMYAKDMRVSCEAIPEEMAGTTPPSNEPSHQSPHHPSLLSCHSYPGSSPPKEPIDPKPYKTVPPSPNVLANPKQPDFQRSGYGKASKASDKSLERPSNLPNLSNLVPLSAKPPQSPTQTSPRLTRHNIGRDKDGHEIQKSSSSSILEKNTSANLSLAREKAKERKNSGSVERLPSLDTNQLIMTRDRTHTISVMSPATRKPRTEQFRPNTRNKETPRSGINPSFVFLQLYHAAYFGNITERPLLVGSSDVVQRSVKILDSIPPFETHKIGVIYIREDQVSNEVEILKNRFGSLRYVNFLQNLGTLIKLSDVDPQAFFLGGLEQTGNDGKFAYIWQDDVIRVTFHVATMMPNKETDPYCNNKKLHIGNNFVTIIYNESGEEYNINTIKSQFNFACIIIEPLDYKTNRVLIKTKEELTDLIPQSEPRIVSDQNVAILARQLALHCNLASLVVSSLKRQPNDPYASNWLERLRKIKNVRNKIIQENKNEDNSYPASEMPNSRSKQMEDFTDYT